MSAEELEKSINEKLDLLESQLKDVGKLNELLKKLKEVEQKKA